jgi:primosomal protein N'
MECSVCGRQLRWINGEGWVHAAFGTKYLKICKKCGHVGGDQPHCPNCGEVKNYVDDHCAIPNYNNK